MLISVMQLHTLSTSHNIPVSIRAMCDEALSPVLIKILFRDVGAVSTSQKLEFKRTVLQFKSPSYIFPLITIKSKILLWK
jgi:hypothetical protein